MSSLQDLSAQGAKKPKSSGARFKACPNCGAAEIHENDCPHCGIVFSKWLAREAARQQGVERPAPVVEQEVHHDVSRTGLDVQISPATRIMRVAVGLFSCLLAFFLYSNGKALADFQLFVVLLTYACVGVWIFATTIAPVSTRQFMVEVVFIAVATIPAYALNPEIFGMDGQEVQKHELRYAPKPRQDVRPLVENTLNNLLNDLEETRIFTRDERNNWIVSVHSMPVTIKLRELAEAGDANDGDVNLINDLSSSLERALVRSWVYRNGDWKLLLSPDDRRGIAQKFNALAKAFNIQLKMAVPDASSPSPTGTSP